MSRGWANHTSQWFISTKKFAWSSYCQKRNIWNLCLNGCNPLMQRFQMFLLLSKEEHLESLHQRIAAIEAGDSENYSHVLSTQSKTQNLVQLLSSLSLASCLHLSLKSQNIHFIKPRISLIFPHLTVLWVQNLYLRKQKR